MPEIQIFRTLGTNLQQTYLPEDGETDLSPAQITLAHGSTCHLQHPVEAFLGGEPYIFVQMNLRCKVAQCEIQFLHRVERHIGTDVACAVTVCAGRANESLAGRGFLHLMNDVRLGCHDQGVAFHRLRKLQYAARAADIVRMINDMRRAFWMGSNRHAGILGL